MPSRFRSEIQALKPEPLRPVSVPNVTPLLGVLIVLVVSYLASLAPQKSLDVILPVEHWSTRSDPSGCDNQNQIVIGYRADGTLNMNKQDVRLDEPDRRLRVIYANRRCKDAYIAGAPDAPYGAVARSRYRQGGRSVTDRHDPRLEGIRVLIQVGSRTTPRLAVRLAMPLAEAHMSFLRSWSAFRRSTRSPRALRNRAVLNALLLTVAASALVAGSPQSPGVSLLKVQPLDYPSVARSIGVTATVIVEVLVRPDGSVLSARAVSAPPLLQEAAVRSARLSVFLCRDCTEPATPIRLSYSFRLSPNPDCLKCIGKQPTTVTFSGNDVCVNAALDCSMTCDPALVRSARCLWLWRCGLSDACDKLLESQRKRCEVLFGPE